MLTIHVKLGETYEADKNEFIEDLFRVDLEHSLVSLSKWESIFEKPFLDDKPKSPGDTFAYVKLMALTEEVPDEVWESLSKENFEVINEYMSAKMTATWFREKRPPMNQPIITSEVIYSWMIDLGIPFECQYWHLNRLFTLIKVRSEKNEPPKKMTRAEIMRQQRDLNAKRRAELNSSG